MQNAQIGLNVGAFCRILLTSVIFLLQNVRFAAASTDHIRLPQSHSLYKLPQNATKCNNVPQKFFPDVLKPSFNLYINYLINNTRYQPQAVTITIQYPL